MIEVCIQMPKTRLSDRDKKLIHLTVANTIKSITEATFSSTGLQYRVRPWPPKRDGSPCWLIKTSLLSRSFVADASPDRGRVTTDRPYAAIHQFGGRTPPRTIEPVHKKALSFTIGDQRITVRRVKHPGSNIPAKPFLPLDKAANLSPAATKRVDQAIQTTLDYITQLRNRV